MRSASSRPSPEVDHAQLKPPMAKQKTPSKSRAVAASGKSGKPAPKVASKPSTERRRFWLNYPQKEITRPLIWELSLKFDVVFNIRQASVSDAIGIVCLELEGLRTEIKSAIAWLEAQGVHVEPVEIGVIES